MQLLVSCCAAGEVLETHRGIYCGTVVHFKKQRNKLWSRDTCCGTEVYVVEQRNILWAEIHVVMQKYILWSRAEVTIVKQRYIYNIYCKGAYCRALVVYVSSAPTADPVIPVSCETPKAAPYTLLYFAACPKDWKKKLKLLNFVFYFFYTCL